MKALKTSLMAAGIFASAVGSMAVENNANTRVEVTILGGGLSFHPVFQGNSSTAVGSFLEKFSWDQRYKNGSNTVFKLPVGSSYPVVRKINGVDVQTGTMAVVDDGGGLGHFVYTPL